jgi:hypothetical protein
MGTEQLALFDWIPAELIHDLGLAIIIAVALAGAVGLATMAARLLRAGRARRPGPRAGAVGRALWSSLAVESLGQKRFREECDADAAGDAGAAAVPWFRRRWFVHAMIVWGFLGLLAATALDYGLDLAGIKPTGTPVPIWYPVRLLGTVAGLALVWGSTVAIIRRVRRSDRYSSRSRASDWLFLVLLWVTGVSGFAIELALYLPDAPAWGYWVFLFHVAIAMELVLLAPFMKLAHAVYRPVGLFFTALAREPRPVRSGVVVGVVDG